MGDSHNVPETKNVGRKQKGDTGTVVLDVLALHVKDSGVGRTGLG